MEPKPILSHHTQGVRKSDKTTDGKRMPLVKLNSPERDCERIFYMKIYYRKRAIKYTHVGSTILFTPYTHLACSIEPNRGPIRCNQLSTFQIPMSQTIQLS